MGKTARLLGVTTIAVSLMGFSGTAFAGGGDAGDGGGNNHLKGLVNVGVSCVAVPVSASVPILSIIKGESENEAESAADVCGGGDYNNYY
ncbi:hypothetical protein [Saccharopolyspora hordei]|uniref:Chaplin domain-containing protein n=1 Tax=Saccharopolyspora hordei TaxID=1838 RepID=A0A853AVG5_9PSEU|nr:hypothetical protein [Saccharopolyspora hordei]NYI86650.1 hypothetical protein [Saccharopolyspora hordei]